MRRVHIYALAIACVLFCQLASVAVRIEATHSISYSPLASRLHTADLLPLNSCDPSPPVSSPPSVAYVANISSLAHWQRQLSACINMTRLMDLLTSLTSLNSRHFCETGANASLTIIASSLTILGITYQDDWFSIPKISWNGSAYIHQTYWTRNLYATPWGINRSAPSLLVTCQVDSARYSLLGLSTSNAPGSNDNAAGVAALIQALEVLKRFPNAFSNWNILFAFLGAEESNGTLSLWGSHNLITQGLGSLGINAANSIVLNVDEIAYKGLFWPTTLTLYRYPDEDTHSLVTTLSEAASNLGISLHDKMDPRAKTLADVQTSFAWSISEWTFHTNNIPSVTLSTDQYPDPNKHTEYDTLYQCSIENVLNTTKLIVSTILALAQPLPQSPPNRIAEWYPLLTSQTNLALIDYLDPILNTFPVIVIDPWLSIDTNFLAIVDDLSASILALGAAGSQLLQQITGASITTDMTQSLQVNGVSAFHPVIQSPHLLINDDAELFKNCTKVYAASPSSNTLILVGNSSWCALGYYPQMTSHSNLLFLGVDIPETLQIRTIATSGLNWLLDDNKKNIFLGVDQKDPQVGTHPTLYIVLYNLTNWTTQPYQSLSVNITSEFEGFSLLLQLETNETGVASTQIALNNPTSHSILVRDINGCTNTFFLTPSPVCTADFQYSRSIKQGERLSIHCYINSDLPTFSPINLSLSNPQVGSISKSSLLLIPGRNFYQIYLAIPPNCPPQSYNLTLLLAASPLILLTDQLVLDIERAFILSAAILPKSISQNEPFPITLNITNQGSQTRAFEIITEGNFQGLAQAIVSPSETRSITMIARYLPQTILDIERCSIVISLYIQTFLVDSIEQDLYISPNPSNYIITLLPITFLVCLCIIGIIWMRNGKKAKQHANIHSNAFILPIAADPKRHSERTSLNTNENFDSPLPQPIPPKLRQLLQQLKSTKTRHQNSANDDIAITLRKNGNEFQIVLNAENHKLLQHLLDFLSQQMQTTSTLGERTNDERT